MQNHILLGLLCIFGQHIQAFRKTDVPKDDVPVSRQNYERQNFVLNETVPEQVIQSRGFPDEEYPPNQHIEYNVKISLANDVELLGARILIYFEMFALEESLACHKDAFEVLDCTGQVRLYCGSKTGKVIVTECNTASLRFFSDGENHERGFRIKLSIYDSPCTHTFNRRNSGEFTSLNFPSYYPKDEICVWKIVAPPGMIVRLKFDDQFDVTSRDETCAQDYLMVSRVGDVTKEFERLCGKTKPATIDSKSNVMLIIFRTDCCLEGTGFKATFGLTRSESLSTIPPPTAPANCQCGVSSFEMKRIVGGEELNPPHSLPWTVGIVNINRNELYCGGSLINNQYVLTAGHCLEDRDIASIKVLLGAHENKETAGSQLVSITETIIHPDYEGIRYLNDIGLVKLENKVEYTERVYPICLPQEDYNTDGILGTIAGWGRIVQYGDVSDVLREVTIPVISNAECVGKYGAVILDTNVCAGDTGKDACEGDSGGPMIIQTSDGRWMIIGVISWGIGCGRENYTGVLARVSKFMNWIEGHTGDVCQDNSVKPTPPPPTLPNNPDCGIPNNDATARIVGGTETLPFEFPWLAIISYNGDIQATGSVVSRRYVLTSASSLTEWLRNNIGYLDVYLGQHNILQPGPNSAAYKIAKIEIHPRYKVPIDYNYDFALLELLLDDDLPIKYRPICVPSPNIQYPVDTEFVVAGWGRTSTNGRGSRVLLKTNLNLVDRTKCNNTYNGWVTRIMICAGAPGKDTCFGDDGTPLMLLNRGRYYASGIMSWGPSEGCAIEDKPSVFAATHRVIAWITSYAQLS